jgi:hypothetical protein
MSGNGWSKQIRQVCLEEGISTNRFPSPDGRKVLVADIHGFHLKVDGALVPWEEGRKLLTSESGVSWSPASSAFFINDGYGLDGWKLKVYVLTDHSVISHEGLREEIVRRFRMGVKCSSKANDPNVMGLGWSEDGASIFSFAQATVNESCGQQGDFRGAVADLAGDTIRTVYSEKETQRMFHNLLPFNMR